ncbi:MAG: hypothetical protein WC464_06325 [Bdellovibrionales bacterium]
MEAETIVIHLPLKPFRYAGRKYLIGPDGETVPTKRPEPKQTTMQRAIVRAFLWRQKIEGGEYDGITDLARKNKLNDAYVQKQLSLTLLAPSIIDAILKNTQPRYLTLQQLCGMAKTELWNEQGK